MNRYYLVGATPQKSLSRRIGGIHGSDSPRRRYRGLFYPRNSRRIGGVLDTLKTVGEYVLKGIVVLAAGVFLLWMVSPGGYMRWVGRPGGGMKRALRGYGYGADR